MSSDAWGGAELHTLALTRTLKTRGHRCVIMELNEPVIGKRPELVPEGVEVRAAGLDSVGGRFPLGPTLRVLKRLGADVGVFAKSFPRVGSVVLDLACRLAFGRRFMTIEHLTPPPRRPRTTGRHFGGLIPGLGISWYRSGLRIRVRSIFPKRIVTVSRAVTEELVHHYEFPLRKMVPIPNGIDPDRFVPDPEARAAARAVWGIPPEDMVFGTVGRLSIPDKGIDVGIDVFARLCEAHPDRSLWYVLIGEGRHEARLREEARATGWGSRILFAGRTERPWEAYPGMDVLLLPSRAEGIGFALLEAMACGCCPVAMGVGGVRDVLTDPSLGWIVTPGDRGAFLEAMEAALGLDPDERAAVGARAREHVAENFRAEVQYGKLADVIERM